MQNAIRLSDSREYETTTIRFVKEQFVSYYLSIDSEEFDTFWMNQAKRR